MVYIYMKLEMDMFGIYALCVRCCCLCETVSYHHVLEGSGWRLERSLAGKYLSLPEQQNYKAVTAY